MPTLTYYARRGELHDYFDRKAVESWKRLTSDAPLNRIRATVRAGRDEMRARLLAWLPGDLTGRRVLDAGCGTGALAAEASRRGADVVAVDLSASLIDLARQRFATAPLSGRLEFVVGDMLDPALGRFDHVVAMDSLIHYRPQDVVGVIGTLCARADRSVITTVAPKTIALSAMHVVGRLFPRGNRAPAIVPVAPAALAKPLGAVLPLWQPGRTQRVARGFYISQAIELVRR